KDGEFELFKTKHNIVVGAMPGLKFDDFEIQLNKGDKLFLYTDGVPEATNKENCMFTVNNMLKALNENKNKSPQEILEGVHESVNAFVGEAPQFDDLTMLCIEIMEKENKNIKSLTVDATVDNLDEVIGFVDAFLEENGCPMKKQMQFDLALEEAYVNVAHYAYGDETGKAEVVISEENGAVTIVLKDSGVPYNPLEKEDPDVTLSAEERQIGGLGIFLVKKNMDSVSYEYKNGQNILTMTKNL
ncbi:MAG: ATP-binding protein, partial [Eubacterium sp.]|nr:ATP-binding protein [Eubacterium sp.]